MRTPGPGRPVGLALLGALLGACGDASVPAPVRSGTGAPVGASAPLARFLEEGPALGTWEIRSRRGHRILWIARHPERADLAFVREADPGSEPEAADAEACVVPRRRLARILLEAPWALFDENYGPVGSAVPATARDATPCLRQDYAARDPETVGETGRSVWYDAAGGEVLQVEDRGWSGERVRGVYRMAPDTGGWAPASGDEEGAPACLGSSPPGAPSLAAWAATTPFPVFAPRWLPPGYVLLAAEYRECHRGCRGAEPLPLASLLYSDGVGVLSLGVAAPDVMEALEARLTALGPDDDPEACGAGTEEARTAPAEGRVIRRRADRCRTVLRIDDLEGVSVTILARNERPADEYLRVARSLEAVPRPTGTPAAEPSPPR